MLTASEINQATINDRRRAMDFERLKGLSARYIQAIDILKPQITAIKEQLAIVKTIDDAGANLPSTVPGKGGKDLRYGIAENVTAARKFLDRRLNELEAKLAHCQQELDNTESALASFE